MCTWLIMYTCASTFCVSLNEMHTHYTSDVIRFSPLMAIYRHKFALPWSFFFFHCTTLIYYVALFMCCYLYYIRTHNKQSYFHMPMKIFTGLIIFRAYSSATSMPSENIKFSMELHEYFNI